MAALSSSVAMMQQQHQEQEAEGGLEVLEADLAEMENSVYHLVRSNVEIAQFLDTAPRDKDLEQALEENQLVVAKKRHRVKALRNAIADLKMYHPHLAGASTATATNPQRRTPPGGFHTGGGDGAVSSGNGGVGGSGDAVASGIGGAGGGGGGGFGGVPGRDGAGGVGSQGGASPGAVVVGAGGVQDITSTMAAAGAMALDSPASSTTALPAGVVANVVGGSGRSGGGLREDSSAVQGGVERGVVEGHSSSRESGGGGAGGGVVDGSGGVML